MNSPSRIFLTLANALKSLGRIVTQFWVGVGALVLLLFFVEGFSILVYEFNPRRPQNVDWRVFADAYRNRSWIPEYWKEFQSANVARYTPYLEWVNRPYQGKYFHFDSEGNRRTWNTIQSKAKPLRIFMFGGSTLWGTGARDDYTIPSILARLLSEKTHQRFEITNFGQIGYTSTQEVIKLLLEIQRGRVPDMVICYDGANDVYSAFQNRTAGLPPNTFKRVREFNLFSAAYRKQRVKEFFVSFVQESSTFRLFNHFVKLNRPPEMSNVDTKVLAREVGQVYGVNLRLIREIGKMERFVSLFYWQPFIYTKRQRTPYEQKQLEVEKSAQNLYLAANAELERKTWASGQPGFHNITHLFDDSSEPLYLDTFHVTEAANETIARRMLVDVLAEIEKLKTLQRKS